MLLFIYFDIFVPEVKHLVEKDGALYRKYVELRRGDGYASGSAGWIWRPKRTEVLPECDRTNQTLFVRSERIPGNVFFLHTEV